MSAERRPGPGEQLSDGPVAVPRQAATIILVRGGAETLEVLLVQRSPEQRFLGGHWVFPGGAVDAADAESQTGADDAAHRMAAVREMEEEAAVGGIDPASIVRFSRWITPAGVKVRFDTHFYLAAAPADADPRVDGAECVDLRWATPAAALAAHDAGELPAIFPTLKHLEQLAEYPTADALLADARDREVRPVEPRIVQEGSSTRVVLPGEEGYEEALAG
jgi:8-oxo-dGTP pyrophosphatase MutT (NUDIX family)